MTGPKVAPSTTAILTGHANGVVRRATWSDRLAIALPSAVLILFAVGAIAAPFLPIPPPNQSDFGAISLPLFSPGHLLGTDSLGRDLLSRILFGAQLTFVVSVASVFLGLVIGGLTGLVAGYRGRFTDALTMRLVDVVLAFPPLVFALALAAAWGPGIVTVVVAIAVFTVPAFARVARASALSLRNQDYVLAARLAGVPERVIIMRHLLPNAMPPLMSFALVQLALAVLIESALSFLGLGLRPPDPSWGVMIAEGRARMGTSPHEILVPAFFLVVTILSMNSLADAVNEKRRRA